MRKIYDSYKMTDLVYERNDELKDLYLQWIDDRELKFKNDKKEILDKMSQKDRKDEM